MERLSLEMIAQEVGEASGIGELRDFRDRIHEAFQRHLLFSYPFEWNHDVNAMHDAIIRRVIRLALGEMEAEGFGRPPVAYGFLLFGSGGRAEQTLWSDQDNGLVYADSGDEGIRTASAAYFAELANKVSAGLMGAGYPPCSGNVICTNDMWRKPLSAYKDMLRHWLSEPDWEHVRYLLIAADVRVIEGDESLGQALKDPLYDCVKSHPAMLEHLLQNTLHHKISLGVFGQLIRERYGEDAGGVDIKYGAYIPIVNGIRLLAIEAEIRESSTVERIRRLVEKGVVEEEIGSDWLEALSIALKLRSLTPYQVEDGQYSTRGKLKPELLTKERINELKLCLRIGSDLQKYVKKSVLKEMEKG
ncbi:DUF294 nucleotidyltransferase-like domain-containing protein [Paenibacillus filicis]|uniref:DUF294 nucleotidyltransferase-like domain-containing protein n=1 Tax=Paenibacillus gyeongsangnamensis TaxID=3388067 RepID=A0ABT4Q5D5_9BACL|nr:DUF294 nucleotidyltransferase-like domain-containing protein [Paenibacillus filicis]MCZ8512093.1 DUF294 nucleotidyltransferase-like domain-containing protein [Paenibacillus filicis]